ncbi:hypothetical protein BC830DRAFT_1092828 [Chytriomyces sp. MP71]|nr:hypothetical protein BC830DRAFT_1092828 [Chytriomyces sp. MP71]
MTSPKFYGFNAPNLHLIEDSKPWRVPTAEEQLDAIVSLAQTGIPVARLYTLSIFDQSWDANNTNHIVHVTVESANATAVAFGLALPFGQSPDPSKWQRIPGSESPPLFANVPLFAALDSAVATAGTHGVRLLIPFIDHWRWWGGVPAFCSLHNVSAGSFFSDKAVVANFKSLVTFVTTRINTVSNISYARDPTIYAWETGNELSNTYAHPITNTAKMTLANPGPYRVPSDWTIEIATLLKSPTVNVSQPVIDGSFSFYGWNSDVLAHPAVDGFTGHYYGFNPGGLWDVIVCSIVFSVLSAFLLLCLWRRPAWFRIYVSEEEKGLFSHLYGSWLRRTIEKSKTMAIELTGSSRSQLMVSSGATSVNSNRSIQSLYNWSPNYRRRPGTLARIVVALLILSIISFTVTYIVLLIQALPLPDQSIAPRFKRDIDLITSYKKLFYVGEFGINSFSEYTAILQAVSMSPALGALIWSLRFHSRDGGFYTHNETTDGFFQSYHLPAGFNSAQPGCGFSPEETKVVSLIREYALGEWQSSVAAGANATRSYVNSAPQPAPVLLVPQVVTNSSPPCVNLSWRGSAGAQKYLLERAEVGAGGAVGPYSVLQSDVCDAKPSGSVLYVDSGMQIGARYSYRVTGVNDFGKSPMSAALTVLVN